MKKPLLKIAAMAVLLMAAMTTGHAQIPITLETGWNWISYPYSEPMTIQEALAGFIPANGDIIQAQSSGNATYRNGRWMGQLTTLVPGEGYMYQSVYGGTRYFVFGGAAHDPSLLPQEALTGDFTVDANGTKVRFSPGNLQCRFNPTKAVEAIVGTGTNTSANMPFNTHYKYSICHMIYRAEELFGAGMGPGPISSIAFESYSTNHYRRDNIRIWMKATTVTQVPNLSASLSGMTKVFDGSVIQQDGWTPISLSTPFVWDGESNVLVTVVMNHGSYNSDTYWQCSSQSPYESCGYSYTNNSAFDPTSTINLTISFDRPNIRFNSKGGVTWRFAEKQWDYMGTANSNASSSHPGWIDLFGWGTSGYPHGANCWQPWSTSTTNSDYYAYGYQDENLNDRSGRADWGSNPISNGGNKPGQWRTLTADEWGYVFYTRSTASGIRFAAANVNGVNGVILLPDNWSSNYYTLDMPNVFLPTNVVYSANTITSSQWSTLEQHGAVFLPAAGYRNGTSVSNVGYEGDYWSTSSYDSDKAKCLYFYWTPQYYYQATLGVSNLDRYRGRSVRLVCQSNPHIRTIGVTNMTGYRATVSWEVNYTGSATFTRGICWNTTSLPTAYYTSSSNYHTQYATGTGAGSFSTQITSLQPNTTYHVRAFVKIDDNTYYYGNELIFTTPEDIDNGHSYVDLGLPSGLLWADCNIGAYYYYDYGDYFAWGETQPKDTYNWDTYQYCYNDAYTMTKYCTNSYQGYNDYFDNMTILLPEDDAATANWGGYWRTPTKEEWEELYNNTTVTYETIATKNGIRFTAANGRSIFLPFAGRRNEGNLIYTGSKGHYWSSSLETDDPSHAWYLYSDSGNTDVSSSPRCSGISVRPVRSPRKN